MRRHILNKREPSSTHISPFVTHKVLKWICLTNSFEETLRKVFQFQNRLMDRGYPHNLKEKLLSEINSKEILVPERKQQGRKINFAFRDSTNPKCPL